MRALKTIVVKNLYEARATVCDLRFNGFQIIQIVRNEGALSVVAYAPSEVVHDEPSADKVVYEFKRREER